MKKFRLTFLFAILLIFSSVFFLNHSAKAEDVIYSGTCGAEGDNITWELNTRTGVLRLDGYGAMKTYLSYRLNPSKPDRCPPYMEHVDTIRRIEVGPGITKISYCAFDGCRETSVSLPDTLEYIGAWAFSYNPDLKGTLVIPDSVTEIGVSAFHETGIEHLVLGKGMTVLETDPFTECVNLVCIEIRGDITSFSNGREDDEHSWFFHLNTDTLAAIDIWEPLKTYVISDSEPVRNHDWAVNQNREVHFVSHKMNVTTVPSVTYADKIGTTQEADYSRYTTMYPKDALSRLGFYGGVVGGTADIEGTWSWQKPYEVMPVKKGYVNFTAVFTPKYPEFFETVTCDVPVYVTQDKTENIYKDIDFQNVGGAVYSPSQTLSVFFSRWTSQSVYDVRWEAGNDFVPPAGTGTYWFTVKPKENGMAGWYRYEEARYSVTISLKQAEMTEEDRKNVVLPQTEPAEYGKKLGDIGLPASWSWENPETVPSVRNEGYPAVYTPEDANYQPAVFFLSVKVTPKAYQPKKPVARGSHRYSEDLRLSSYMLVSEDEYGTWQWTDVDQHVDIGGSYEAEYVCKNDGLIIKDSDRKVMLSVDVGKIPGVLHPEFGKGYYEKDCPVSYDELVQLKEGSYKETRLSELVDLSGTIWEMPGEEILDKTLQEIYDESDDGSFMFTIRMKEDRYYAATIGTYTVRIVLDADTVPEPEIGKEYLEGDGYRNTEGIPLPAWWTWLDGAVTYENPAGRIIFSVRDMTGRDISCVGNAVTEDGNPVKKVMFDIRPEPTQTPAPTTEPEQTGKPESTEEPSFLPTAEPGDTPEPTVEPANTPSASPEQTGKPEETEEPSIPPAVTPSAEPEKPEETKEPEKPSGQPVQTSQPSLPAAQQTPAGSGSQTAADVPVMPSSGTATVKKVKLNRKKVTLKAGRKARLKLLNARGKVKWSSSRKKVAAVSRKGVVRARKKGKAVISVRYGGRKYRCLVVVKRR